MGTALRFAYLPIHLQESLAGSILNISVDPNNPRAGIVEYEFCDETFEEADLSLLLSILLYSSIQGSTKQLRLLDVDLPESLWSAFPGPRFGSEGLRRFMPNDGVPLFGVILKPRQGLTPELAASIAAAATRGGADYVIDDEVLVNNPRCRLIDRANAIMTACEPIAERRGRPLLYVVNVISRQSRVNNWLSELSRLRQGQVRLGIMVNGLVMGFETVTDIRRTMPEWPLIATTVASGMLILSPNYNISEHVLVQLARLAGADAVYAVRHATEYAYDPSKIYTLQKHLSQREESAKRSMPIYAGSITLGTIVRGELPSSPDFMVQAGSTVCGYNQVGQRFPDTIEIATRTMVDAITSVYAHGLNGQTVAENIVRQNGRRGGINLSSLGLSS